MAHPHLSKDEQSAVREFASRLRDRFPLNVEALKLYGSKARGAAHEDSDVDVLVLVKERNTAFDESVIDLVCDVLNEFGVFIETVTLTADDFRSAVEGQYPFAINVERDAIEI